MIVFLLYGGMIWGVFPCRPGISFESHLSGAVIGIVFALLLKNADPRPPEKKYSWEDEDSETPDLDTLIKGGGDKWESLTSWRKHLLSNKLEVTKLKGTKKLKGTDLFSYLVFKYIYHL